MSQELGIDNQVWFLLKIDDKIKFIRHTILDILNTYFEALYVNATVLEIQYLIECVDWLLQILQKKQKKQGLNFFNDVNTEFQNNWNT